MTTTSNQAQELKMKSREDRPFLQFGFPYSVQLSRGSQRINLITIFTIAFLLRCFTASFRYSGYHTPPMYGDFEAQRHWMEITTQLPTTQWYFHDRIWWPLDYPPLSAYHSWILGKIGGWIEPEWFALYRSRGVESLGLKVFMRSTVIFSEVAVFFPAAFFCVRQLGRLRREEDSGNGQALSALAALLLQPAIIMIDHGHFQYNSVMLGFFIAAVASFFADRHLLGCACFVAALGFKQMALFYAPAVAAYLAGTCIVPSIRPMRFLAIAAVTGASFVAAVLPVFVGAWRDQFGSARLPLNLSKSGDGLEALTTTLLDTVRPFTFQLAQILHRIFPFSRGLFEDKVANIWCSIQFSGLYKISKHHSHEELALAAISLTAISILPPCLIIFLRPRKELILLAFTTCAWAFFLCSYQVHEKNVLLPLLPMTALLAAPGGMKASTRAWVGFANIVSCWTLFHLLIKDSLQVVYFPLLGVWSYLLEFPPFTGGPYRASIEDGGPSRLTKCVHFSFYAWIAMWHLLEHFVLPRAGKADLWIVLNIISGCGAFGLCYLWCLWTLLQQSGLLAGLSLMLK